MKGSQKSRRIRRRSHKRKQRSRISRRIRKHSFGSGHVCVQCRGKNYTEQNMCASCQKKLEKKIDKIGDKLEKGQNVTDEELALYDDYLRGQTISSSSNTNTNANTDRMEDVD